MQPVFSRRFCSAMYELRTRLFSRQDSIYTAPILDGHCWTVSRLAKDLVSTACYTSSLCQYDQRHIVNHSRVDSCSEAERWSASSSRGGWSCHLMVGEHNDYTASANWNGKPIRLIAWKTLDRRRTDGCYCYYSVPVRSIGLDNGHDNDNDGCGILLGHDERVSAG